MGDGRGVGVRDAWAGGVAVGISTPTVPLACVSLAVTLLVAALNAPLLVVSPLAMTSAVPPAAPMSKTTASAIATVRRVHLNFRSDASTRALVFLICNGVCVAAGE